MKIKFKSGYKYQLAPCGPEHGEWWNKFTRRYEICLLNTPNDILEIINCGEFLSVYPASSTNDHMPWLSISPGYAWDGASGPTFDTGNSMAASLVHDAGYQLIRNRVLPADPWKKYFDDLFYSLCVDAGMWAWRAKLWYVAVSKFGDCSLSEPRKIHEG